MGKGSTSGVPWGEDLGKGDLGRLEGARLQAAIPAAPMQRLSDVLTNPHTLARHMLTEMQHPTTGTVPIIGRVLKFAQEQQAVAPAPLYGQHSRQGLRDMLGYSA